MGTLILLRHGQSEWNLGNRFTGWSDVALTDRGRKDAATCANTLRERGFRFDRAFSSRLVRAIDTLDIILNTLGQNDIPIEYDSALNERHYGDLQGLNKAETAAKYGEQQVQLWRRDYSTRPPGVYGESVEDCGRRTQPFFTHYVIPRVAQGESIILSAHGNSLRPIMKYLENLDPDVTAKLEIGLCTPYVYTFDGEKMTGKEEIVVPGIVTKGASIKETQVAEGRV